MSFLLFTIPRELRSYFAHERKLLNLLFEAAAGTVYYQSNKQNKTEGFTSGMVCTLHTFGWDLKWNPHIHMSLTENGIGNCSLWRDFTHINYEGPRCSWQFLLLKLLSDRIKTPQFKALANRLYAKNQNGFYVRALPNKNMNITAVVNYIVRYIGRPVMAQSRITNYDGKNVTFWYQPHDKEDIVTETISAFDFIKRLIIHIPEQNLKMLRYYSFYSVNCNKHKIYLTLMNQMTKLHYDYLSVAFRN